MKTHRFDPISFVLGVITIFVGFAAVNSRLGNIINDRPDALLPLIVLAAGLMAVVIATRRSLQGADASLPDVDGAGDDTEIVPGETIDQPSGL